MILAIDTSMGTSVAVVGEDGETRAERLESDVRGHAEAIGRLIADCLAAAAIVPAEIDAVAIGMGPGPYTGLRVGIAAARAFARGRDATLLPVPSHDAIREQLGVGADVAIATPAGRRGHYVSVDGGTQLRHDGPGDALQPEAIRASALARVAIARRAAGQPTGPAEPLYLREPDVTPPGAPRRAAPAPAQPPTTSEAGR